MTVECNDGFAIVNIAGRLTPEDLRKAITDLCLAHAKITDKKIPDGTPLFHIPAGAIDLFTAKDLSLVIGIRNATIGCVSTTILPESFGVFLNIIGTHLNNLSAASAANAAISERQISGASVQ